jgi:NADPH2:quinone reductase
MATRIEFQKHGGPEVLKAVEFTPSAWRERNSG